MALVARKFVLIDTIKVCRFRVSRRRVQKFGVCPPTVGGTNLQIFSGTTELLTLLTFEL